jgi:hypothetical protein
MYKTKCTTSLIGLSRTLTGELSVLPSVPRKLVLKCVHVFTPRLFRTARLTAAAVLPRGRRAWLGSFPDKSKVSCVVVTKMFLVAQRIAQAHRAGARLWKNL